MLPGMTADQLASLAALKVRLVRQVLQRAVDADKDTASRHEWELYFAHLHFWCNTQEDFEIQ